MRWTSKMIGVIAVVVILVCCFKVLDFWSITEPAKGEVLTGMEEGDGYTISVAALDAATIAEEQVPLASGPVCTTYFCGIHLECILVAAVLLLVDIELTRRYNSRIVIYQQEMKAHAESGAKSLNRV